MTYITTDSYSDYNSTGSDASYSDLPVINMDFCTSSYPYVRLRKPVKNIDFFREFIRDLFELPVRLWYPRIIGFRGVLNTIGVMRLMPSCKCLVQHRRRK